MNYQVRLSLLAMSVPTSLFIATAAVAQEPLPRSYVAAPNIYKVLARNDDFVIVEVTWKPGQKDVAHSHPASGVYFLNDCTLSSTLPDGKTLKNSPKAGFAIVQPPVPGHVVENVGTSDCRLIMFEPAK